MASSLNMPPGRLMTCEDLAAFLMQTPKMFVFFEYELDGLEQTIGIESATVKTVAVPWRGQPDAGNLSRLLHPATG